MPANEMNMKRMSLFSRHLPIVLSCLGFTYSCSDEDGPATDAAVGSVNGGGAGGASASLGGTGGSASTPNGDAGTGSEMGGANGLAMGGSSASLGGVGPAGGGQGGSAGAGMAGMAGMAGSAGSAALVDAGAADSGAGVSYARDIQPILQAQCSPCHTTDNDGRHNAASSYADAVRVSADIVREISTGGMPESGSGNQGCNRGDPGDPGCVSAEDFALIQRWVAAGTPE
jgi:hypothetical protein